MRDIWTFIGGVAVGILAITGVFAMDEEEPLSPDDEVELEDDMENVEVDDNDVVIMR